MKIAIYSGTIPSSTFVEHLINGISQKHEVLLFGIKKDIKTNYNNNVKIFVSPSDKYHKIISLVKWFVFLMLSKPKILLSILKTRRKGHFKWNLNYYNRVFPIALHPPEILHIQWAKSVVDLYPLRDILNLKIVVSLRGAHINYSPLSDEILAENYRKIFPEIDGFHAVSSAIAQEAESYGADKNKIKVIRTAVSNKLFQSTPPIVYKNEERLKIISVGNTLWKKGFNYALDAINMLKKRNNPINYTLVLNGYNYEEINYHIQSLGLEESVSIVKNLPHAAVIELLKNQHLLLLSSVEEGIANVVIEAMAVGVPVISTECGGMSEVVKNDFNGLLIESRNSMAIADAVEKFLNMGFEKRKQMINNARLFVKENHNMSYYLAQFESFYSNIVHSNK